MLGSALAASGDRLGAMEAYRRALSIAESALVSAETAYEKSRIEVKRATGSMLEDYGISIADAKSGVVEESSPLPENK